MALVIVRHKVAEFATWKRAFDGHAPARAEAGFSNVRVYRSADDVRSYPCGCPGSAEGTTVWLKRRENVLFARSHLRPRIRRQSRYRRLSTC